MPSAFDSQSSKASSGSSAAAGAAHFDERGRAADERGPAAGVVGVLRERAHERQVDVDVRIDEAGEDVLACWRRSTSAPAGAARLRPMAVIVSPSQKMSAMYWSLAVVIWPFLMSSDMEPRGKEDSRKKCSQNRLYRSEAGGSIDRPAGMMSTVWRKALPFYQVRNHPCNSRSSSGTPKACVWRRIACCTGASYHWALPRQGHADRCRPLFL